MPKRAPARGLHFVGRDHEISVLRTVLDAVQNGRGAFVLLAGEAGIGKTRLAQQVCAEAETGGAWSVVARCHEGDVTPAYWPWLTLVRDLAARAAPEQLRAWLGDGASAVAEMVPEVGRCAGLDRITPRPDPDGARFRFFDAVTSLLERAAIGQPLVLLLDDLQWADDGSLELLRFAARELDRSRVLLLGTVRDQGQQARSDLWSEIARLAKHLPLAGLTPAEVAEMLRAAEVAEPDDEVTASVHTLTGGNPFFVDVVARVLAASPDGAATTGTDRLATLSFPAGVHDAIRGRLRPLDAAARRLLAIAALIGRPFSTGLLARAAGRDHEDVATALAEGERYGLLVTLPGNDDHGFAHALVAETLVHDLDGAERARLHRRIAEAFVPMVATGAVSIDQVAAHYFEAIPAGAADEALAYAVRAGELALQRLAYEDAARYHRRALDLLAETSADPAASVDLLLALGEAERRAGNALAARDAFGRAAAAARDAGRPDALARAALGYGAGLGGFWDQSGGLVDAERVALVRSALDAIGPAPSGLRAQLLAHMAASLFWSTSPERRTEIEALGREAVSMASSTADEDVALAVLASAHWTSWGPDDAEGRLHTAEEIVRRADAAQQSEILLRGLMYAAAHHLELGDVRAADRAVARFSDVATELGQRRQLWYVHVHRAMRAHLAGRFDEAERLVEQGLEIGEQAQPLSAHLAFGSVLSMVRREQARPDESLPFVRRIADSADGMPVWRCALASLLIATGEPGAARDEFERLAQGGFAGLQRNFLWLYGMTHLARTCSALADAARASVLYDLLLPYAGRVSVAQHGVVCDGAVDRYLGLLAGTVERWDEAERHFARALELDERIGARTFVAATCCDHAEMLRRRDRAADASRASALLERAAALALENGQIALRARIAALDGPGPATTTTTTTIPARAEDACTLRREGKVWTLSHGGRVFSLRETIGFGYLVTLLRHPGRDFHAFELLSGGARVERGDAGEVLDPQARAAYRARLQELGEELDDARRCNDAGRAERAQAEIEALTEQLARAVGLHQRARRAGSDAERARLNVTRALRRAIAAVATHDATLGSDLDRGVSTGAFCCYTPDPRFPIRWTLG